MFGNYLAAALRNLARNRLYAGINIVGLAVGFAAALLIALYVRDELSFDSWIPGYRDIYQIVANVSLPGRDPIPVDRTTPNLAALLKRQFAAVAETARITEAPPPNAVFQPI